MKFEWDKQKRLTNIQKHNIDFADVTELFYQPHLIVEDERFDYEDERFWAIGFVKGQPTIIVHTYIGDDVIRIVSARKATRYEQQKYFS
jgi:hypothetical protein